MCVKKHLKMLMTLMEKLSTPAIKEHDCTLDLSIMFGNEFKINSAKIQNIIRKEMKLLPTAAVGPS